MKVCLVNTADSGGGAPVASARLLQALEKHIEVKLLVQQKKTGKTNVVSATLTIASNLKAKANFLLERVPFIAFHERDKSVRFAFSTANFGTDISRNSLVKTADIIHLHWINSGFLSLVGIKNIFRLNKPVIWTMHDMWTFTGGCHYAGECDHFLRECGDCKFLRYPSDDDISRKGWIKKKSVYAENKKAVFVACSEWLAGIARKSSLLKGIRIEAIANPINTSVYQPLPNGDLKDKWNISQNAKVILFGAANINDKRKGISYLLEALEILKNNSPELQIEIILFGKNKLLDVSTLAFPTKNLSVIKNEQDLVEIYNLADVFVLPSLEDNLPNMVMEALSCAVPVVAFNQGGVPEMLDHQQNGYVAAYKSSQDMANGIKWVLNQNGKTLKTNARQKVLDNYSEKVIAQKYIELYQSML